MKIISWNVAGLRALLKKNNLYDLLKNINPDIICFQETKAEEHQIELIDEIKQLYPYRYWNSNKGLVQRKGLSGTAIFSKIEPINILPIPLFDNEGRVISLEFNINNINFILINVYVPNSQKIGTERFNFRNIWNNELNKYLISLNKEIVLCGDMNVAHKDIDIVNPNSKRNKIAGFYDMERNNMSEIIFNMNYIDVYRYTNQNKQESTYWSNFLKQPRSEINGWRIDYFLISYNLFKIIKNNHKYENLINIYGSDHCPLLFEF